MQKSSTDFNCLQALRKAAREARERSAGESARGVGCRPKQQLVFVEDIIVSRLIDVEADLVVAVGLFQELEDDKSSPLLKYGQRLSEALITVQDALYLRNPELYE